MSSILVKNGMNCYHKNKLITLGAATLSSYGLYKGTTFQVEQETIAILVFRNGGVVRQKVYGEGTHLMIPLVTKPVVYSDRFVRPFRCFTTVKNKEVTLKFLIVANPVPDRLPNLYKEVGDKYDRFMEENIDNALNDVMPECKTKKFFSEEKVLVEEVKERLAKRLDGNIAVDKVDFFSIKYGP